jgi:hypothetical protein
MTIKAHGLAERETSMADYYLQFSETIDHLTEEEEQWLRDQLWKVVKVEDRVIPCEEASGRGDIWDWEGPHALADMSDEFQSEPFEWDIDHEEDRGRLTLFAEEYGEVGAVGEFVRRFLARFRPNDTWSMTYSCSCSRPRPGDFGGGALMVTRDGYRTVDTSELVDPKPLAPSSSRP